MTDYIYKILSKKTIQSIHDAEEYLQALGFKKINEIICRVNDTLVFTNIN